jgi:acetylornithine/succinyldiaminopimelate/putrescine aminotransferase
MQAIADQCKNSGALFIMDEIQTGIGRLGIPFVNHHSGVKADISTAAKSLGGGFPVGAMLMTKEIAEQVKMGDLGSTFGGSPLAAAAVIATLEIIKEENLLERATEYGNKAKEVLADTPGVSKVLGVGCLLGLKIQSGDAKETVNQLQNKFKILTGTSGVKDVMRLLPPYNTPLATLNELKDALCTIKMAQ